MSAAAARADEYIAEEPELLLAFELGQKEWKLAFGEEAFGGRRRQRTIRGGDLSALMSEIAAAKEEFGMAIDGPVTSCYEAGREAFWLDRFLRSKGIDNHVVDSSSIRVDRRQRRAKTDSLDVKALLNLLIRYRMGDPEVWSVVRVPSREDEDARSLHRELKTLKKERTRSTNRIKGLLVTQGIRLDHIRRDFLEWLDEVRLWDGTALLPGIRGRIEREYERRQHVHEQILELKRRRREAIREGDSEAIDKVRKLSRLKSIGSSGAWTLVMELFGWRQFNNRRELGGLSGLVPTPYQSGDDDKEQGVSKSGNRWVRGLMVELAWSWVRWQPDSELTRWYLRRFGSGGKRTRKVGIVALARKLLVALWKYVEFDEIPEGAIFNG